MTRTEPFDVSTQEPNPTEGRHATGMDSARRVLWWVGLVLMLPVPVMWVVDGIGAPTFASVAAWFAGIGAAAWLMVFAWAVGICCWIAVLVLRVKASRKREPGFSDQSLDGRGGHRPRGWRRVLVVAVTAVMLGLSVLPACLLVLFVSVLLYGPPAVS